MTKSPLVPGRTVHSCLPRVGPGLRDSRLLALGIVVLAVLSAALAAPLVSAGQVPGTTAPSVPSVASTVPSLPGSSAAAVTSPVGPAPTVAAPAPAAASPELPSNLHLVAPTQTGPTPNSWGGSPLPPGAILPGQPGTLPAGWGGGSGNSSVKYCYGIWPDGGQSLYQYSSCYGADEPGIDFYSPLPGSAGNLTWNVTLPVDRSPTLNQSDLYSAIWLGMTLTDPYAWMDACFLELQFYPDSSWYAPGPHNPSDTVYGQWVGEAVAWQISAQTGAEDACFVSPLFTNGVLGPNFFNMSQGDHIQIKLNGWTGDPYGENISIQDQTNGNRSFVNLENRTGDYANEFTQNNNYIDGHPNYPLDPSYVANNVENALAWTPGGEFPVAFAFEVGHAGNPTAPENNPVGGCSPGVPPNNPSTPCPSYDPGSWLNDTRTPWQISAPVFSNGTRTSTPAQVAFSQDLGALDWVDNATGSGVTGACEGAASTSWCSYPWYSYSCSEHAFNFGATDWAATSVDFGKDNEWSYQTQYDAAGLGYFPPANYTIPACGAPTATVGVQTVGGGTTYFLTQAFASNQSVGSIGYGDYSLGAMPAYGHYFTGWTTTGSLTVTNPNDAWANLVVTGSGTVTATFSATPPTPFSLSVSALHSAGVEIVAGAQASNASASHLSNGASMGLFPGVYSILATPGSGYNFSSWSLNNSLLNVASPTLPFTTLVVPAGGGSATLTVSSVATQLTTYVYVEVVSAAGSGKVSFNGNTGTTGAAYNVHLGAYSIVATPGTGWQFAGWEYTELVAVLGPQSPSTYALLEQYPSGYESVVAAVFAPAVTFDDSPASDGGVAVASQGYLAAPSGTTYFLNPGTYTIAAAPKSGYAFSSWSVSSPSALWVPQSTSQIANLIVNKTGTVTAAFALATSLEHIWVNDTPTYAGEALLNYAVYSSGATNTSIAPGEYAVFPLPAPGFVFSHWVATGDFSVLQTNIVGLSGSSGVGSLTAVWSLATSLVSFTGYGQATIGSTTLLPGTSAGFDPGSYSLSVSLPTNTTFVSWSAQGGVSVASDTAASTTLVVGGPGTVTALETAAPLVVGPIAASSAKVPVNEPVTLNATVTSGPAPFTYRWTGCGGLGHAAEVVCTPTIVGNYTIDVNVTDAFGDSQLAPPFVLEVETGFTVALRASPASVTLGNSVTFTAAPTSGEAPFSYQYVGLPTACGTPTTAAFGCTPTVADAYNVTVLVRDARGFSAEATLFFTVNPPISLHGPVASPAALTLGTSTVLTTVVSGGTYPLEISYGGLPTGCASINSSTLPCGPSVAGTFNITIRVSDAGGGYASAVVGLTVNPVPTVQSFQATPSSIVVGGASELVVSVAGGTEPFTYSYSGLPADCSSANTSTLLCMSRDPGNYSVRVVVTDADGKTASAVTLLSVGSTGGGGGPSGSSGGLSTTDWILIAVVVLVVLAVLGVFLARRHRPGPPGPGTADEARETPAPAPGEPSPEAPGEPQDQIYGR